MIETSPLPDEKPLRKPVPTPPPRPVAAAAPPPSESSESSSEAALDELLADQRAGETWIKLTPVHVIRAADLREIEETEPATYYGKDEAGTVVNCQWPVKGLLINGKPVTHPQWTLEELLEEIGVEIRESPKTRSWINRKSSQEQSRTQTD